MTETSMITETSVNTSWWDIACNEIAGDMGILAMAGSNNTEK